MSHDAMQGRCLCGAIQFSLRPPVRPVIVCHCRQCARWTGHAVAATAVAPQNFALVAGEAELRWFRASAHAARGFCGVCGSSLFWKPDDGSRICVLAGAFEPPTGLEIAAHIFTADKSDYYTISDGLRQYAQGADVSLLARIGKSR